MYLLSVLLCRTWIVTTTKYQPASWAFHGPRHTLQIWLGVIYIVRATGMKTMNLQIRTHTLLYAPGVTSACPASNKSACCWQREPAGTEEMELFCCPWPKDPKIATYPHYLPKRVKGNNAGILLPVWSSWWPQPLAWSCTLAPFCHVQVESTFFSDSTSAFRAVLTLSDSAYFPSVRIPLGFDASWIAFVC